MGDDIAKAVAMLFLRTSSAAMTRPCAAPPAASSLPISEAAPACHGLNKSAKSSGRSSWLGSETSAFCSLLEAGHGSKNGPTTPPRNCKTDTFFLCFCPGGPPLGFIFPRLRPGKNALTRLHRVMFLPSFGGQKQRLALAKLARGGLRRYTLSPLKSPRICKNILQFCNFGHIMTLTGEREDKFPNLLST